MVKKVNDSIVDNCAVYDVTSIVTHMQLANSHTPTAMLVLLLLAC